MISGGDHLYNGGDITVKAGAILSDESSGGMIYLVGGMGKGSDALGGDVAIASGTGSTGSSGNLILSTASEHQDGGMISIQSGRWQSNSKTGGIDISARHSEEGTHHKGSNVTVHSAASDELGGAVLLNAGRSEFEGGEIRLRAGDSDFSGGSLAFESGDGEVGGSLSLTSGHGSSETGVVGIFAGASESENTSGGGSITLKAGSTISEENTGGGIVLVSGESNLISGEVSIASAPSRESLSGNVDVMTGGHTGGLERQVTGNLTLGSGSSRGTGDIGSVSVRGGSTDTGRGSTLNLLGGSALQEGVGGATNIIAGQGSLGGNVSIAGGRGHDSSGGGVALATGEGGASVDSGSLDISTAASQQTGRVRVSTGDIFERDSGNF
jgi:hypothetical protein